MTKRYLPHLGIALGVAIAVYALFFSKSDEDRVREVLNRFADTIAVGSDENNIVLRAARIKGAFNDTLIKDVRFDVPELSQVSSGRAELTGLAAKAPQIWRTANVDLGGLEVSIDTAGDAAIAVGDAHLDATRHDGQLQRDTRKVSISLDKIDGNWRIVAITVSAKDSGT